MDLVLFLLFVFSFLETGSKIIHSWGCRDGLGAKNTTSFLEDLGFIPSTHITACNCNSGLGGLMLSSGFHVVTGIHVGNNP